MARTETQSRHILNGTHKPRHQSWPERVSGTSELRRPGRYNVIDFCSLCPTGLDIKSLHNDTIHMNTLCKV